MKGFKKKALAAVMALSMFAGMLHPMSVGAAETENRNVLSGKQPSEVAWFDGRDMEFTKAGETDSETAANATDGSHSDANLFYRYGEAYANADRKSYLEYDLGGVYEVTDVNMWRYWADARNYAPTVIVLSEDETFNSNDTVIYSSDAENVFGFGTSALLYEAAGYGESASGKLIDVDALSEEAVTGRYIRLYAAGSNVNTGNHLVEFEVYANVEDTPDLSVPMENSSDYLELPTFDAANKVDGETHPDIIDMSLYDVTKDTDGKWHGYRYYMAITPNQNGDSQYENPYLLASNDGLAWEKLEGLAYPLTGIPREPNPLHNCDADIVYNEETDEIYLYYVWTDDSSTTAADDCSQLRLYKIAWDDQKEEFYSITGLTPITSIEKTDKTYSMLSPTVIKDGDTWKLWYVDTDTFRNGYMSQLNHVDYCVSKDGINWSDEVSLGETFVQDGYKLWHIDVQKIGNEYWALFPAYVNGGESGVTDLFYAKSNDGLVWTTYEKPLLTPNPSSWDNRFIYRSTFLYDEENDMFRMWYSGGAGTSAGWRVGYTENTYTNMVQALGTATTATGTVTPPTATEATFDKTVLTQAITESKAAHAEAAYTPESWAVYAAGLALAEAMADDTDATYAEVNAVIAELERVEGLLRTVGTVVGDWVAVSSHSDDIVYEGGWNKVTESNGSIAYSYEGGASATLSFYGSGIRWIGQKDGNFGSMKVYVDGELAATVNQNGSPSWHNVLFEKEWTTAGYHKIRIESAQDGVKDVSGCVDVEKFEVYYDDEANIKANELILDASTESTVPSGTVTLTAVVNPFNASNRTVSFSSSDEAVATVSEDGVVSALKGGTVTITAEVAGTELEESVEITVRDVEKAELRKVVDNEHPLFIHHLYRQQFTNLPGPLQGGKSIQGFWDSIVGEDGQGYDLRDDLEEQQVIVIHASGEVKGNASTLAWYEERFEETVEDQIPFLIMVSNSGTSGGGNYLPPNTEWVSEMYDEYPNMLGVLFSENHNATADWERQARSDYMNEMVILAAEKGGYVVYSDMNDNRDYIESVLRDETLFNTLKQFKDNFILLAKTTSAWGNGSYNSHESAVMGAWMADIAGNWGSLIDSWMWFIEGFGPLYGDSTFSVMGGAEECRGPVTFPELFYEMRMIQQARVGATVFTFEHPDCVTSVGTENGAVNHFTPTFTESVAKAMEYMSDYDIPTQEEVLETTKVAYCASEGTIQDLAGTRNLLNPLYGDTNWNGYNGTTMMLYSTGRYGTIPSLPELATEEDKAKFDYVLTKKDVINNMNSDAAIKNYFDAKYPKNYTGTGYAHYLDNTWYAYNSNWNIDSRVDAELHTTQNVDLKLKNNKTNANITFEPYTTVLVDDQTVNEVTFKFNNYLVDKNPIWEGYIRGNGYAGDGSTLHWNSDADDQMYQYVLNDYINDAKTKDDIYRNAAIVLDNLTAEPTLEVVDELVNKDGSKQAEAPKTTWDEEEGTFTIELSGNGWMEFKVTFNDDREEIPAGGPSRLTISNEKPLLLVPVYCQNYNANGSEMQWGDTLLGRWNSIPEDIKENVVMLIHAGACASNKASIEGFYRQQLEIAEKNDIPVMLTTITAGLVPGYTATAHLTDEFLAEMMETYTCLKGFASTENYWVWSANVANTAARHLTIAAENGGYMIWYDHLAGTDVFEAAVENRNFKDALDVYGDNFAFCWKNTPSHANSNAASASYVQGLWLNGTINQWGGIMDTWKWYENRYGKLFEGTVSYNANGNGGADEECRAVVMEPEALLSIEMLSIYANGGTIYSFEHPAYTQGVEDLNTPAFTESIYRTFKYIVENPAPSRDEVIEDTEVVIHGDPDRSIFTGVTSDRQNEPTYKTGQYGLIPVVPEAVAVCDELEDKVVDASEVSTSQALKAYLEGKYTDSAYEGDAFAQKVDDKWIVYNSSVNVDKDQTATVAVEDLSVTIDMEPHTFAIVEPDRGTLNVYMNNYRVDKNSIWEGYGPSVTKWDADVNTLLQDWLKNSYITNTADEEDTYRITTFELTGLEEAPTVEILNAKEDDFTVDVAFEDGTAEVTVKSNGLVEFNLVVEELPEVCEIFTDVPHGAWYEGYVQYVYDNGLMAGNNGLFNPTKDVTRAQLVTTLYRLAGEPEVTDYKALTDFTDVAEGLYYTDAVCWAYNIGVGTGNDGKFNPTGNLTRQQMAAFLYRFAGEMGYDTTQSADYSDMLNADQVSDYAKEAVSWAVGAGLISGSEVTNADGSVSYDLKPRGNTTRAQLAAILQRFCEGNDVF